MNVLSVEGKVEVIRQTVHGKRKSDKCREFDVLISTSQMIRKNRTEVFSALERRGLRINHIGRSKRSDVSRCLSGLSNGEMTVCQ